MREIITQKSILMFNHRGFLKKFFIKSKLDLLFFFFLCICTVPLVYIHMCTLYIKCPSEANSMCVLSSLPAWLQSQPHSLWTNCC